VFVLPFIVSAGLFFVYPVIETIIMSFQEIAPGQREFVGLSNYRKLVNPRFFTALRNSFVYTTITIAVLIPVPMLLSVLLNSARSKGGSRVFVVFRSMLFLPSLMSVVVVGTVFRLMFASSDAALANAVAQIFGFEPREWLLQGQVAAMALLLLVATWRWTGINIIYFLAGLQQIPVELYESAELDGANAAQKFRLITVPLLKPVTVFVLTISVFGGFAMFEESFVLWGATSPSNVGLTMVKYIYQQGFQSAQMGLGSAVGITLLAIVFLVSITLLKATGFFKQGT
jgi:arabinosaccharide transport system permease protein